MASASNDDYFEKTKSNSNNIRSGFLGKTGTDENPIDKTYYQMLNVSPTASSAEIKRAYYTYSLQYHPDRTQNLDEFTRREYAERFKQISQAYSILSDPEKRTLYNRYGKDERIVSQGSDGISLEMFDAEEFFRSMFGGQDFVDILGDFEISKSFKFAISELLIDENEQTSDREMQRSAHIQERKKAQEKRIEDLSKNLIMKLSVLTDALQSEHEHKTAFDTFTEIIRSEIPNLLEAPYGEQLLHAVGYVYSSKARLWLSKMDSQDGHPGKRLLGYGKNIHSTWKDRIHIAKEAVRTVKSAFQWQQSISRLANVADEELNHTEYVFQHHSGHLEYSGLTSTEATASASNSTTNNRLSPVKGKEKSLAQPTESLEERKQRLEKDTAVKSMEALWRAAKLEIELVQREVCDKVLSDPSCPREILRNRCKALAKIGALWQQATSTP